MKLRHLVVAAAMVSSSAAMADTASDNFRVTLTILGACNIVANDLDFGTNTGAITTEITAQSSLLVTCTNGTPYSIGLGNGVGAGATASVRKMTNAADSSTVNYSLFTENTRTNVWDNNCTTLPGTATSCVSGTGSGAQQTLDVFGRVAASQPNVTVGAYVDTVIATLTF